jgi:hypothetical protein
MYYNGITERSLVVGIPHPRERAHATDDDSDVGDRPNDKDHVVVDSMVSEVVHDLEDEPPGTGYRASAVNTT